MKYSKDRAAAYVLKNHIEKSRGSMAAEVGRSVYFVDAILKTKKEKKIILTEPVYEGKYVLIPALRAYVKLKPGKTAEGYLQDKADKFISVTTRITRK